MTSDCGVVWCGVVWAFVRIDNRSHCDRPTIAATTMMNLNIKCASSALFGSLSHLRGGGHVSCPAAAATATNLPVIARLLQQSSSSVSVKGSVSSNSLVGRHGLVTSPDSPSPASSPHCHLRHGGGRAMTEPSTNDSERGQ